MLCKAYESVIVKKRGGRIMCNAPVGKGQSYWGLIQVSPSNENNENSELTAVEMENFKQSLKDFLSTFPNQQLNLNASLANGTTREDELSPTSSLQLYNANAARADE